MCCGHPTHHAKIPANLEILGVHVVIQKCVFQWMVPDRHSFLLEEISSSRSIAWELDCKHFSSPMAGELYKQDLQPWDWKNVYTCTMESVQRKRQGLCWLPPASPYCPAEQRFKIW